MASNLTHEDYEELRRDLAAAEPYSLNDKALMFDGDMDSLRIAATLAKQILDEYPEDE
ncbi:hypothetical protein LJC63_01565 [Ruminococcaceae bacterium OttesenSCG-928-L11]|nr:hypothetical protein [Ruminococcaceae bacterium OttesenSCG-928-L11]